MRRLVPSLFAVISTLSAAESLIEPGSSIAVIQTPHLLVFVPAAEAAALRPLALRADVIYAAMAQRAGYAITRPLRVLLSSDVDEHNGFSTVIPYPLVQLELAPARPRSGIFDGGDYLERTLTHEFAHHLSNDRNHGFRGVLDSIFGRVLPSEPLSLLLFYLSTPAHVTMPSFWHEGLAQWAETAYAPPGSVWGGRGRDPLTHMVWRLDAASGRIPPVGEWKLSYQQWPFGNRTYAYGAAYTRWLESRFGAKADLWKLIDAQSRQWAFAFNDGPEALLGADHATLLARARLDLLAEQERQLTILRSKPITPSKRLTPIDSTVSIPAWTNNHELFAALNTVEARPTFVTVDANGKSDSAWRSAYAMGEARSLSDGTIIYAETPGGVYPWADSRIYVLHDHQAFTLNGARLLQPDVTSMPTLADGIPHLRVSAIQLGDAGTQTLVWSEVALHAGTLANAVEQSAWHTIPVQGRAWSPAFRPGHDELSWVETDATGSRLILAPRTQPDQRTVLADVRGRLIHPCWSADGSEVFFCADHSGVANAYVLDPNKPNVLVAITNVIGGVTACVPSFDGRELALIDVDVHGPYLSRIANDREHRLGDIPQIVCSWPAPTAEGQPPRVIDPLPAGGADPASASIAKYHGVSRIRPWFWTPTTFAAPEGGFGVTALATDPLATHQITAGIGVGPSGYEPVGVASWIYSGWPVEFGVIGMQNERTYNNLLLDSTGDEFDYVERVATGEIIIGRGLSGFRTRLQAYVTAGIADYSTSEGGAEVYENRLIITQDAFQGQERFAALTIGYNDQFLTPVGYAEENGLRGIMTYRHSGFGGELDRNSVIADGSIVASVWPSMGHQFVLGGQAGWSDGDQTLQGTFSVGGILGLGLPRGYTAIEQTGNYLLGLSLAYRLPLWRPFSTFGSTPWMHRQVVLEAFLDGAEVSTDRFLGNGSLYQSAGGELHDSWEFYGILLQPGIGVVKQLDGEEDTVAYFTLGFRG